MKTAPVLEEGGEEELNELLEGDWVGPPRVDGPGGTGGTPDAEQGSIFQVGTVPRGAGAPAWSMLLPLPVWEYLSRLEFYEGDATLPARERLFHHW